MWIPQSAEEIEQAVQSGHLQETLILDAKADLSKKSKSIAEDVAAMANEGGVLIYGIGQNEHKHLTDLNPIPLKDAGERVNNIVQTSLSPPPRVEILPRPTTSDGAMGYLVVVVPLSPDAPHMVIVDKDHRYYGRSTLGNVPLSEGQVAQLYARRRVWERNTNILLASLLPQAPLQPNDNFGYLHLGSWPVGNPPDLVDRARKGRSAQSLFSDLIRASDEPSVFRYTRIPPAFTYGALWRIQPDGWEAYLCQPPVLDHPRDPDSVLDMQINNDGVCRLFCGRVAQRRGNENIILIEDKIAETTTRFFWMMGQLYHQAGFLGPVDLGIIVTGIQDAISAKSLGDSGFRNMFPPFKLSEYRRIAPRVPATALARDPRSIARQIVLPLVQTSTAGTYDPFVNS
jgi:Putative DNA-binding domain